VLNTEDEFNTAAETYVTWDAAKRIILYSGQTYPDYCRTYNKVG